MNDYTPTTSVIRCVATNWDVKTKKKNFDRWLNEIKTQAWEEGYAAGDADATGERLNRDNPYIPEIGKTPQHFPETGNNV